MTEDGGPAWVNEAVWGWVSVVSCLKCGTAIFIDRRNCTEGVNAMLKHREWHDGVAARKRIAALAPPQEPRG